MAMRLKDAAMESDRSGVQRVPAKLVAKRFLESVSLQTRPVDELRDGQSPDGKDEARSQ
jgi:hypothetical protein